MLKNLRRKRWFAFLFVAAWSVPPAALLVFALLPLGFRHAYEAVSDTFYLGEPPYVSPMFVAVSLLASAAWLMVWPLVVKRPATLRGRWVCAAVWALVVLVIAGGGAYLLGQHLLYSLHDAATEITEMANDLLGQAEGLQP